MGCSGSSEDGPGPGQRGRGRRADTGWLRVPHIVPIGHIQQLRSFPSKTTPPLDFKRPALESTSQKLIKGTIRHKNTLKDVTYGEASARLCGCWSADLSEARPDIPVIPPTFSSLRPLSKVPRGYGLTQEAPKAGRAPPKLIGPPSRRSRGTGATAAQRLLGAPPRPPRPAWRDSALNPAGGCRSPGAHGFQPRDEVALPHTPVAEPT